MTAPSMTPHEPTSIGRRTPIRSESRPAATASSIGRNAYSPISVPTTSAGDTLSAFDLATYDAAKQPPLIQPYINPANGQRVGLDPVTKQILPAVKIGTFSANAGTPFQGMKLYKEGILNTPAIQPAPRIGFPSYDHYSNARSPN